jgi:hypothetical protein
MRWRPKYAEESDGNISGNFEEFEAFDINDEDDDDNGDEVDETVGTNPVRGEDSLETDVNANLTDMTKAGNSKLTDKSVGYSSWVSYAEVSISNLSGSAVSDFLF